MDYTAKSCSEARHVSYVMRVEREKIRKTEEPGEKNQNLLKDVYMATPAKGCMLRAHLEVATFECAIGVVETLDLQETAFSISHRLQRPSQCAEEPSPSTPQLSHLLLDQETLCLSCGVSL